MTKSIQELIDSLEQEDFDELAEKLLGDLSDEELEHYGVLGMKWGVRRDRRTGKKVGSPVKGTKKAKHTTPSVSPKTGRVKSNPKPKPNTLSTAKSKTARTTPSGETALPSASNDKKRTATITTKLNQKQKSKLGNEGLNLEDLDSKQLKNIAERMKLEKEISQMLDGPDKYQAMQVVVNRIKLEEEYKKLTAAPPTRRDKIRKEVNSIVADVARHQARNILNNAMNKQVREFFKDNGVKKKK